MLKTVLAACVLLCAFTINAEARQRHKATGLHPECNITMPCAAPSVSTPAQIRWDRGMYISRQIGLGGPKTAVRPADAPKPRQGFFAESAKKVAAVPSYGVPAPSIGYSISRPGRYIAGRLVCAVNVGAALAERGIKGTGSALAHSYDGWGRASGPQPGAVAVTDRRGGGHVAIVSRVEGGRVFVWNATGGRNGWHEIEYTHRHARYRVAG